MDCTLIRRPTGYDRRTLGQLLLLLSSRSGLGQASDQDVFQFRSGFWINLHHFVFQQVRESENGAMELPAALTPAEIETWKAAFKYYRDKFSQRNLLERDMAKLKNILGDIGDGPSLGSIGIDEDLIGILERVAPVYRTHFWPDHDRNNRAWIDKSIPLVIQDGAWIKARISSTYQTQWPSIPIVVDVVSRANWAGAYTTLYPTRISISSQDQDQSDLDRLEVLFHEASHGLVNVLQQTISQRTRSLGKLLPRKSLWHAVLFYTTGEILRERYPDYVPYAQRKGLWDRAWPNHLSFIETHWKPYLEGELEFRDAINDLVDALAVDPQE